MKSISTLGTGQAKRSLGRSRGGDGVSEVRCRVARRSKQTDGLAPHTRRSVTCVVKRASPWKIIAEAQTSETKLGSKDSRAPGMTRDTGACGQNAGRQKLVERIVSSAMRDFARGRATRTMSRKEVSEVPLTERRDRERAKRYVCECP